MIRAVSFDLWETLITNTPQLSDDQKRLRLGRMEAVLARRGFTHQAHEIERAYHAQWQRCQELYWSRDTDVPVRVQLEHFFELLGVDVSAVDEETMAEVEDVYSNAIVDLLPEVVGGAGEVLRGMKERGFLVGMISNTGRTPGSALRQVLQQLDLGRAIDAMVFSNEHGACKPQRSIFEELRGALGVAFEEMLFIGDNLYVDVLGAQRCGMFAVHFTPPRRGSAVAPPIDHPEEIVADATIADLRELPPLIDALTAEPARTRRR